MIGRPKFVLASGSPRRLALVNQAGIEPDALKPADLDETPHRGEIPRAYATRLAHAKATAALENVNLDDELRGAFILSADTVVAVGRRILPKAELLDEPQHRLKPARIQANEARIIAQQLAVVVEKVGRGLDFARFGWESVMATRPTVRREPRDAPPPL